MHRLLLGGGAQEACVSVCNMLMWVCVCVHPSACYYRKCVLCAFRASYRSLSVRECFSTTDEKEVGVIGGGVTGGGVQQVNLISSLIDQAFLGSSWSEEQQPKS